MKPMEHNSFFNEAIETINRIQKENPMLHELNWFFETAAARFNRDYLQTRNPDVSSATIFRQRFSIPSATVRFMCLAEASRQPTGQTS